jgi:CRISPR-associated protein Cmr1
MKRREQELFGGVGNEKAERSKVIIRVNNLDLRSSSKVLPQNPEYRQATPGTSKSCNVLEYLAYGVVTKPGNIERPYFIEGSEFEIILRIPEDQKKVITDIAAFISFFGGIGSRSRNGYGSFSINGLEITPIELFKKYRKGELKDYSAFSQNARLFRGLPIHQKWEDALFEVGNAYRTGRLRLEDRHSGEKRKYISQPLSIRDSYTGSNKITIPESTKPLERNAKCFFIGITKTDGMFQGHILYLPHSLNGNPNYLTYNDELANSFSSSTNINEVL